MDQIWLIQQLWNRDRKKNRQNEERLFFFCLFATLFHPIPTLSNTEKWEVLSRREMAKKKLQRFIILKTALCQVFSVATYFGKYASPMFVVCTALEKNTNSRQIVEGLCEIVFDLDEIIFGLARSFFTVPEKRQNRLKNCRDF